MRLKLVILANINAIFVASTTDALNGHPYFIHFLTHLMTQYQANSSEDQNPIELYLVLFTLYPWHIKQFVASQPETLQFFTFTSKKWHSTDSIKNCLARYFEPSLQIAFLKNPPDFSNIENNQFNQNNQSSHFSLSARDLENALVVTSGFEKSHEHQNNLIVRISENIPITVQSGLNQHHCTTVESLMPCIFRKENLNTVLISLDIDDTVLLPTIGINTCVVDWVSNQIKGVDEQSAMLEIGFTTSRISDEIIRQYYPEIDQNNERHMLTLPVVTDFLNMLKAKTPKANIIFCEKNINYLGVLDSNKKNVIASVSKIFFFINFLALHPNHFIIHLDDCNSQLNTYNQLIRIKSLSDSRLRKRALEQISSQHPHTEPPDLTHTALQHLKNDFGILDKIVWIRVDPKMSANHIKNNDIAARWIKRRKTTQEKDTQRFFSDTKTSSLLDTSQCNQHGV